MYFRALLATGFLVAALCLAGCASSPYYSSDYDRGPSYHSDYDYSYGTRYHDGYDYTYYHGIPYYGRYGYYYDYPYGTGYSDPGGYYRYHHDADDDDSW